MANEVGGKCETKRVSPKPPPCFRERKPFVGSHFDNNQADSAADPSSRDEKAAATGATFVAGCQRSGPPDDLIAKSGDDGHGEESPDHGRSI